MVSTSRSILITYLISIGFFCVLIFCSWKLRVYSYYYKAAEVTLSAICEEDTDKYFPAILGFRQSIEQLVVDSSEKKWVNTLKNDTSNYSRKVIAYSFSCMKKMQVQVFEIRESDSNLQVQLLVNNRLPFIVHVDFFNQGNSFYLNKFDNIYPLYERLHCNSQYLNDNATLRSK